MFKSIRALNFSSGHKLLAQRKVSGNQSPSIMSLAIFAKVANNGVSVVDSQTLVIRIASGGQITLTFGSTDQMMGAAEAMAFNAAMITPTILVPSTPRLGTSNNEVIAIDDTPPVATPRDQNSGSENLDNSDVSRDMLASDDDEDSEDAAEAEDQFEEEELADGVRRVKINPNHDDSFEDTIGLSQEFW
jgi:hypothetical protein